ncbi:hypothetical protein [Nocardia sp. NPDC057030]|uniref:hypothetical protein n=1 Tax=unclassified Nocardia TaxID=2637762 RepID=UPI0036335D87
MKTFTIATGLVAAVLTVLAPASGAAWNESAQINELVYQDSHGDLDGCIKLGSRDIFVSNGTSTRTAYIYRADDCTGDVAGTVAPDATGTVYGSSVEFKEPAGGGSSFPL